MAVTITHVTACAADVPYRKPFAIAGGVTSVGQHVLVAVTSSDGLTGYGEAAPMPTYSEDTQGGVLHATCEHLGPAIVGLPVSALGAAHRAMDGVLPGNRFAKAGIDLALFDLASKTLGLRVCDLLGGAVCSVVPTTWCIGLGDPWEVAEEASVYAARGFGTIKIKVGYDPERDVETVRAVRAAVGHRVRLRVDANQGYDLPTARTVLERMAPYNLELVEQPMPAWNLRGLTDLRQRLRVPVLADESAYDAQDVMELVRLGAADAVNIKLMKPGGLYGACKMAAVCEAAGLPIVVGSMPEYALGTAAAVHFAAALGVVSLASDLVGGMMFSEDILAEPFFSVDQVAAGGFTVPDGPGLGVPLAPHWERRLRP